MYSFFSSICTGTSWFLTLNHFKELKFFFSHGWCILGNWSLSVLKNRNSFETSVLKTMCTCYSVLSLPAGMLLSSKRDMMSVAEPAKLCSALSCLQESTYLHAHISVFKWGNNWDMEGRKSLPPNSPHLHHISSWEIKIYLVIIKLLYSYFQDCNLKDGIFTSFFIQMNWTPVSSWQYLKELSAKEDLKEMCLGFIFQNKKHFLETWVCVCMLCTSWLFALCHPSKGNSTKSRSSLQASSVG